MKGFGWFFVVVGSLNIIVGFIAGASGYVDVVASRIGGGVGILVLGLYMISRAKKKEEEQEEKDKWSDKK